MPVDKHDSKNIKDANQTLQDAWPIILAEFEKASSGTTLNLTCTHRTPEKQFELFKLGRNNLGNTDRPKWSITDLSKVVTHCDGTEKTSKHNLYPALAIDVVVIDLYTKKAIWEPTFYMPLKEICKKLKLVWGGNWVTIKDYPHIECGGDSHGASSSKNMSGFSRPDIKVDDNFYNQWNMM